MEAAVPVPSKVIPLVEAIERHLFKAAKASTESTGTAVVPKTLAMSLSASLAFLDLLQRSLLARLFMR